MIALNFMHLGSEPVFKRTGYIDLCNGEYIKLVKNTVSSSNPGNHVFSNQTKTSRYEQKVFAFALSMCLWSHTPF